MPTINIDYGYFIRLGELPFYQMMIQMFFDFGWIPFVIIVFYGSWRLWVQWRQNIFAETIETCLLAVDIPRQNEQTAKAMEHIFATLGGAYSGLDRYEKYWLGKFQPTFSFEIAAIGGYVQFLVHTWTKHRDLVEAAIYSQYRDAEVIDVNDYADRIPSKYPDNDWDVFGTEFKTKKGNYLPIRTYFQFEHTSAEDVFKDPISGLLETMSMLKKSEQLWIQILVEPNDQSWQAKAQADIDKMMGKKPAPKKTFFDDAMWLPKGVYDQTLGSMIKAPSSAEPAKDDSFKMLNMSPGERGVLEAAQMKLAKIGFDTKIRVVYAGRKDVFSKKRFSAIKGYMMQYSAMNMNELKPFGKVTPKSDYFHQRWFEAGLKNMLVSYYKNRSGKGATSFVLNTEELATLWHFPMLGVKAPLLKRTDAKRAEPPSSLPTTDHDEESVFKPRLIPRDDEELSAGDKQPPQNLPFA